MPHHHRRHAHQHGKMVERADILDGFISIIGGNLKPKETPAAVSIIYVTAKPTFDGPIAGYSTEGEPPPPPPKTTKVVLGPPIQVTPSPTPKVIDVTTTVKPPSKPTSHSSPTDEPSSSRPKPSPSSFATSASSLTSQTENSSTPTSSITSSIGAGDDVLGMSTATPTSTAVPAPSGMSAGAKAGIALGILALIGLLAGAALLFIRKKKAKDAAAADYDNEKPFAPQPVQRSYSPPPLQPMVSATAPQLNVRPVTQFSPDFIERGPNSPNMVNVAGTVGSRSLTEKPGSPNSSDPFTDPVNPFEPRPGSSSPPTSGTQPLNVRTPSIESSGIRTPTPEGVSGLGTAGAAVAAGTVAIGAAAAAGAAASSRSNKPATLQHVAGPPGGWAKDMPPPSPAMSMESVSVASTTAAAVAAGAPGHGTSNVHRVQLDFAPSMEDELELRAGQLVRLLHEYDDGWALCIRLDRSQQGVAPRTCLSARPVKPRPRNGPGPGPGPRVAPNGRSMSPAPGPPPNGPPPQGPPKAVPQKTSPPASPSSGYRPYVAPGTPVQFPNVPRTLSPGPGPRVPQQPRSMSPGPYGPGGIEKPMTPGAQRQRSNSAAGATIPPTINPGPSALGGPVQNVNPNDKPEGEPAKSPAVAQPSEAPAPIPVEQPLEKPVEKPAQPSGKEHESQTPPPALGPADKKPVPGQAQ